MRVVTALPMLIGITLGMIEGPTIADQPIPEARRMVPPHIRAGITALLLSSLVGACGTAHVDSTKAASYQGAPQRLFVLETLQSYPVLQAGTIDQRLLAALRACGIAVESYLISPSGTAPVTEEARLEEAERLTGAQLRQFKPDSLLQLTEAGSTQLALSRGLIRVIYDLSLFDAASRKTVWRARLNLSAGGLGVGFDAAGSVAAGVVKRLSEDGILHDCSQGANVSAPPPPVIEARSKQPPSAEGYLQTERASDRSAASEGASSSEPPVASVSRAEDFNCPPPGLTLKISDGARLRYEGRDGLWCMRSLNGKPFASDLGHVAFYNRARAGGEEYNKWPIAVAELWPITPGKSVSFIYQGVESGGGAGATLNSQAYAHDVTVESPRQITVPAGTFTVYPIVDVLHGMAGNYHRSSRTYYYAPQLGANVKFEYRLLAGSQADQPKSWEVVAVIPP
jgi:hypothetical protein